MMLVDFLIATEIVTLGDVRPLAVPALEIVGDDLAGRLEHLAHRAASLLGLAQSAPELVGHPEIVVPLVPAEGLVARRLRRR